MRRNKGFTLIESMMVIAILAILAAVALPSMREAQANARVKSVAGDIAAAMAEARAQAAGRQRSVSVTANTGGWNKGWKMAFTVMSASAAISLADHHGLPESAVVTVIPDKKILVFQSNGMVQDEVGTLVNAITFLVCDSNVTGERGLEVTLSALGRTATKKSAKCG